MSSSSIKQQPPNNKSNRLGLLKLFAPQVPNLLVKSAGYFLSLTPQSEYWDLRTTLTVEFLRLWLGQSKHAITVEDAQAITTKPQKVQANTWKVDVEVPVGAEDAKMLEEVVRRATVVLGSADIEQHIPRVGVENSTGEWVGFRAKVPGEKEEHEEREGWSEGKKYHAMMEEVEGGEDGPVVLLLHGGMFQISFFISFFTQRGGGGIFFIFYHFITLHYHFGFQNSSNIFLSSRGILVIYIQTRANL